jgi:2-phospho-L-lactate/phosphoenolpyruvate guanylyltransferase
MKLWLIVPVKPLDEAKSRLAPILSSAERAALMAGVLDHVLACAQAAETLAGIIVISRDQAIRKRAQAFGAIALHEAGHELNSAPTPSWFCRQISPC